MSSKLRKFKHIARHAAGKGSIDDLIAQQERDLQRAAELERSRIEREERLARRQREEQEKKAAYDKWLADNEALGTIPAIGTVVTYDTLDHRFDKASAIVRIYKNCDVASPPGWVFGEEIGFVSFVKWPKGAKPHNFHAVKVIGHSKSKKALFVEPQ